MFIHKFLPVKNVDSFAIQLSTQLKLRQKVLLTLLQQTNKICLAHKESVIT
jgi:hypothetical protein